MSVLVLTMPSPPSLNRLWSTMPGKRRVRSVEYSAWLRDAGWEIRRQMTGRPPIDCRYNLEIQVPISRRDTGNWEKAISDVLEAVGVVTNDGNAHRITVTPTDRADCAVELMPLPEMDGIRAPGKPKRQRGTFRAARPSAARIQAVSRILRAVGR